MQHYPLIILSYHQFHEKDNSYAFSRTFEQFSQDISKKVYDLITIDDMHHSCIEACDILRYCNIRAKLFCPTDLIGKKGYCTWDEVYELSKFHDIENHSHMHVKLTELDDKHIKMNLMKSNRLIHQHTGRKPRFFVPPFNTFDSRVENIAKELDLILLKDRITITKNSK